LKLGVVFFVFFFWVFCFSSHFSCCYPASATALKRNRTGKSRPLFPGSLTMPDNVSGQKKGVEGRQQAAKNALRFEWLLSLSTIKRPERGRQAGRQAGGQEASFPLCRVTVSLGTKGVQVAALSGSV
jgi:hypothetical protein